MLMRLEGHAHHGSQVGKDALAPCDFQLRLHKWPLLFQEEDESIRRLLNVNLWPC